MSKIRVLFMLFPLILAAGHTLGQDRATVAKPAGETFVPLSSIHEPRALAAGIEQNRAVTNVTIFVPAAAVSPPTTTQPASTPGYYTETPASVACLYGLVPKSNGCNPNIVHQNPSGGSHVIAIVDAFDAPNAEADLIAFSQHFGLARPMFQKVYATGVKPEGLNVADEIKKGWEVEISLDIEWAHAMAPGAKIILVEAASNSNSDLMVAEAKASGLVHDAGGGEVSNSWGGSEFGDEMQSDPSFAVAKVVYLGATGDQYFLLYPATSPNVVAVGGTSIERDAAGSFLGEVPWWNSKGGSGAGSSAIEARPGFQASIVSALGDLRDFRGAPDIAAVADPTVGGVWVYNSANSSASSNHGWLSVGGTSAATPIIAALINDASRFAASSQAELSVIYGNLGTTNFTDITSGKCGPNQHYSASVGWDYCTGVGTPNGKSGL